MKIVYVVVFLTVTTLLGSMNNPGIVQGQNGAKKMQAVATTGPYLPPVNAIGLFGYYLVNLLCDCLNR